MFLDRVSENYIPGQNFVVLDKHNENSSLLRYSICSLHLLDEIRCFRENKGS